MVIDLFGLTAEESAEMYPSLYQHVLIHDKPERDLNNRDFYRKNWWIFGEPRRELRPAIAGLHRYIATIETSKHRFFTFLDKEILPDNKLIAIASNDGHVMGLLSSVVHVTWSLAAGSWLGVGNNSVYVKTRCFEPFPFPVIKEGELRQRIRDLGERIDAHRKHQQGLHPDITLTGIYNVLQKLRTGEALDAKEKAIHDKGLVSMLKRFHDDLDAIVLEAYGWTDLASAIPLSDILARGGPDAEALEQQLLTRLVALNHERAAEEARGLIRWLRPDFQAPRTAITQQAEIVLADDNTTPDTAPPIILDWPAELPAQVAAVRKLLPSIGHDPQALAACFGRKSKKRSEHITAILDTLKSLGHII